MVYTGHVDTTKKAPGGKHTTVQVAALLHVKRTELQWFIRFFKIKPTKAMWEGRTHNLYTDQQIERLRKLLAGR